MLDIKKEKGDNRERRGPLMAINPSLPLISGAHDR